MKQKDVLNAIAKAVADFKNVGISFNPRVSISQSGAEIDFGNPTCVAIDDPFSIDEDLNDAPVAVETEAAPASSDSVPAASVVEDEPAETVESVAIDAAVEPTVAAVEPTVETAAVVAAASPVVVIATSQAATVVLVNTDGTYTCSWVDDTGATQTGIFKLEELKLAE
jgi:hypothetical protein